MHAATPSPAARPAVRPSNGSPSRFHRVYHPLVIGIALVTVMFAGAAAQAETLTPNVSTEGSGDNAAAVGAAPSAPGWFVIVDDNGNAYSPEAEAFTPGLAELRIGIAAFGNAFSGSCWYVIVDESGRAYSPEAEAFHPELADCP